MRRITVMVHDAETGDGIMQTRGTTGNAVLTHRDIFDTFMKELGDHLWQRIQDRQRDN